MEEVEQIEVTKEGMEQVEHNEAELVPKATPSVGRQALMDFAENVLKEIEVI